MSLMPRSPDGYYDEGGRWQRTKFCFVYCGAACTCQPPGGVYTLKPDDLAEKTKAPPPSEDSAR
jgi:hypothetical protein